MRKDKYRCNWRVLVLLSSFLMMGAGGSAVAHNEYQFMPLYQEFRDSDGSAPPTTGPEVKRLSVFVGNWTAEGELKPGPMGPGGKMPIARSCGWTYDGIGLLCREIDTIPGMGKVSHVILISYDAHAGDYVLFNASSLGHIWICRGTVNGDMWIWTGQHTMDGENMYLRLTQKWTSKDSFDFKDEAGPAADSMTVTTDGKGTRVKTHAGNAAPK